MCRWLPLPPLLTSSHVHLLWCFLQNWPLTTGFIETFYSNIMKALAVPVQRGSLWMVGHFPHCRGLLRTPHQKVRNGGSSAPCAPRQCMAAPLLPASPLLSAGRDGAHQHFPGRHYRLLCSPFTRRFHRLTW